MNAGGFALAALTLGLGAISLRPTRGFFPAAGSGELVPHATLEEVHYDDLEITDHPVEQGAAISDHAFKRPAEVIIRCAFSNSPPSSGGIVGQAAGAAAALGGSGLRAIIGTAATLQSVLGGNAPQQAADIYETFVNAQRERVLFDVYTGKRKYSNMLIRSIGVTTDAKSENALLINITCREVLIVSTTTVDVPIKAGTAATAQRFGSVRDFGQSQLNPVPSAILQAAQ